MEEELKELLILFNNKTLTEYEYNRKKEIVTSLLNLKENSVTIDEILIQLKDKNYLIIDMKNKLYFKDKQIIEQYHEIQNLKKQLKIENIKEINEIEIYKQTGRVSRTNEDNSIRTPEQIISRIEEINKIKNY